ncbi:unnamed protein product, partial [Scytosiphon promiscuus]
MPGVGDLWGIWEVKEVKGRPRQTEARELLQRLADQVKPICVAHEWKVPLLVEFVPKDAGLLGMNVNRGQKICIRLRPASDEGNFYPYENVLGTMLHELVHMEIGPHSAKFYKMLDQLTDECDKLIREGITGRNMPFAGEGQSLGGVRGPADVRAAALKAAEKRQRQQGIMGGGGRRLGGLSGALSASDSVSAAQRAAAAAQWRAAVSQGCGGHRHGSAAGQTGGHAGSATADLDGWACSLCTLINAFTIRTCDACGTERPPSAAGFSTSGGGRSCVGGGGSRPVGGGSSSGTAMGCEKRQASAVRGASGVAGPFKTASTQSGKGDQSLRATGSGGGAPSEATWTCRKCPFNFPNGAERRTCESCGAARGTTKPASGGGTEGGMTGASSAGAALGGVAAAARTRSDRGGRTDSSPWACPLCTFLNSGRNSLCGVCQAERPLAAWQEAAATATNAGPAGEWTAVAGDEWTTTRGGFGGSSAELSSGGVRERSTRGGMGPTTMMTSDASSGGRPQDDAFRVCRVCTLRNPSGGSACAACGIPFAESDAAAASTAAAPGAEVWALDEEETGSDRRG